MDLEKIIGSIAIGIILIVLVFRRIKQNKALKSAVKGEDEKRQKTISAIRKRSIGGELLVDYAVYNLNIREKIKYTLFAAVVIFGISYLFYSSLIFSTILSFGGI